MKTEPNTSTPDTERKGGARRERIIGLAAELFAEKGIAATTVRDIGNAAGILSGSLYYHFDSKESIVKEIISAYLKRLIASYESVLSESREPREQLEGLIRVSFEAIDRDRHACEMFQNDAKVVTTLGDFGELEGLTSAVRSMWMRTINSGVEVGVFRSDINPNIFYRFARDTIWFTVRWYNPSGPDTPETLSRVCTSILLDGFASDS